MWATVGGVRVFSGMDALLKLCISDSLTLVCSAWGVGWLGGASASKAVVKDSLVSRVKAGVCVARLVSKPVRLKRRSLKGARLQASRVAGLIHCLWLGCLYISISRFRLLPYPSRRW